jgi:hypothetical protein
LDLELHRHWRRDNGTMLCAARTESARERPMRASKRRSDEQRADCWALQRWVTSHGHEQWPMELELHWQESRQH